MKGGPRRFFALAAVIALVGCTNDYGQFDLPEDVLGDGAAGASRHDSGTDQSATGGGGSQESDGEPEGADDQTADDGALAVADAVDAGTEAEASSDAPSDVPADAQVDAPMDASRDATDATLDATDAMPDAMVDAGNDVGDVGSDAAAEAVAPPAADAAPEAAFSDNDAAIEADLSADGTETTDAADDAEEIEAAISCGPGTKPCNSGCASITDPSTGCAGASCDPCALPHATATCGVTGECAVLVCGAGFEDCDTMPGNGCEAELSSDIGNCGSCGRACAGDNVLSKQCAGGLCVSTCALGHSNCSYELIGADDGCERAVDDAHCGSCGNDCTSQGSGLKCGVGIANQCGCATDDACRVMGSMGTCDVATGLCACGSTTCAAGEACRQIAGPADVCSCNGSAACTSNQTCCQSPGGCRDLRSDPSNCGACGRTCPIGFFCSAGQCQCSSDGECNAGTAGTCSVGQCVCGGITCAKGQRCQSDGTCG